jgi:hypothetical protein
MNGVLEERLPHITATPIWQDDQTGNHPEMPIYPIIRVADRPIVYPHSLAWQATAPHNAAQCGEGTRNVPEKPVMPQAHFILPEVIQLGGRDRAEVHYLNVAERCHSSLSGI